MVRKSWTLRLVLASIILLTSSGIEASSRTEAEEKFMGRLITAIGREARLREGLSPEATVKTEILNWEREAEGLNSDSQSLEFELLLPSHSSLRGRVVIPVRIFREGKAGRKVYLLADIKIFQKVVVSKRNISRLEVIGGEDVEVKEMDVSLLREKLFTQPEKVVGREATYLIPKGAMLRERMLREPPAVRRNSTVEILAEIGNIKVRGKGIALDDGSPGEVILVRNMDSRKKIEARVLDTGHVKVRLP